MPSFGEGFASAMNGSFSAVANAYQAQQVIQLEKQKQNIEGYQQFYNMLQTMDPGTLKAMKPTIMQNFFGVDPKDKAVGAFFDQAVDGNTQIGKSIRDAFSSLTSGDPNNPVMQMMTKMPIQNFAAMARDPSKMASFLSSITAINQNTQGINLMNKIAGGSPVTPPAAAPSPSAPATSPTTASTAPQAAAAATPSAAPQGNATYTGELGTVTATPENQTNIKNFVRTASAAAPATAQAAQAQPAAAPATVAPAAGGPVPGMPAQLAAQIADLRHKAQLLSIYPTSKAFGQRLGEQADKMESDWIAGKQASAAQTRANAAVSQANTAAGNLALNTKKSTFGGVSAADQNAGGFMPGAVVQRSGTGELKVAEEDPNKDVYKQQQTDILDAQRTAHKALPVLNTMLTTMTGKTQATSGPALEPRLFLARLATALGHPDISPHLLGSGAAADVQEAARSQVTSILSAQLRKNFGAGSAQLENLEDNLGEMSNTKPGQIAIVKGLIAAENRADQAGNVFRTHVKQFGRSWTRETNGKLDPNGQDAFDKVNSFLSSSDGVPQSVLDTLNASTKTIAQPQPGASTSFKFLGAVQ